MTRAEWTRYLDRHAKKQARARITGPRARRAVDQFSTLSVINKAPNPPAAGSGRQPKEVRR